MNGKLQVGGAIILVLLIALAGIGVRELFSGPGDPDADVLERWTEDLETRNAELQSQNEKYIVEIRDLNAQVGGLAGAQPGGMATEEKRKALAVREAELDGREKRLAQREEQLRVDRAKLEGEKRKFYNDRGLKVEEIGQAKEIKENQERMLATLAQAEERAVQAEELANDRLIAIRAILSLFVIGIIALVVLRMIIASKNKIIYTAMRAVESLSLSTHDRNLLMASLGVPKKIEQSRENDSED